MDRNENNNSSMTLHMTKMSKSGKMSANLSYESRMHDNYHVLDSVIHVPKKRNSPEAANLARPKKARKHKKDEDFSSLNNEFGPDLPKNI